MAENPYVKNMPDRVEDLSPLKYKDDKDTSCKSYED